MYCLRGVRISEVRDEWLNAHKTSLLKHFWSNVVHIFEDGNDYLTKIPQTFCFTRYLKASAALENSNTSLAIYSSNIHYLRR